MSVGVHLWAILLVVVDIALRATRMRLLLGEHAPSVSQTVAGNACGDAASAVTPARLGGEPARFVAFRYLGSDGHAVAVALAAEHLIDLLLLFVVGISLFAVFADESFRGLSSLLSQLASPTAVVLVVFVVILAIASVVLSYRFRHRLPTRVSHSLRQLWHHSRTLSPALLTGAATLSLLSMAARVAILPVLLAGVGNFDVATAVMGSFVLTYGQLLLPIPAGAGAVELGFMAGVAGTVDLVTAGTLLVTWRVYTLVVSVVLGGLVLLRTGLIRRLVAGSALLLVVMLIVSTPLDAQSGRGGSRIVPVDHWSYAYLYRLRERGVIDGLNPLVQPYTGREIVTALDRVDVSQLEEPEASWVKMLREEFSPRSGTVAWGAEGSAGARASTSQRLDPLRPTGDEEAWPFYRAGVWVETGPLSAEVRVAGDVYFNDDPDGLDPGQRVGGRSDHAYVRADFGLGSVTLGRLSRNWTVADQRGVLVSDAATPYPQLAFQFGAGRFTLRSFTGELETLEGRKRFVAAHRLDYATDRLVVSLGESMLYANTTGMSLRFLNPLEFFFFDRDNAPLDAVMNLMLDAQVWYLGGPVVLFAEGLLDDFDVTPGGNVAEPPVYAFTAGAKLPALQPWLGAALVYQQVSAWAYRTPNVVDRYSYFERGLGQNYSDYDRLTVQLDLFPPVRGLELSPRVQFQRQGEGEFRDSIIGGYQGEPTIFLGQKETTYRLGLRGRYQPIRHVWLAFDVGQNWVRDKNNVAGDDVSEFSAAAEFGFQLGLPWNRGRERR